MNESTKTLAEAQTMSASLDGTLLAIVAADRLQLSEVESKDLVHRRLTVFYGYFALVDALAAIATRLRSFPPDIDQHELGFIRNVQSAHAILLMLTFLLLRFWVRDARAMRAVDVLATLATAATAALALSSAPRSVAVDVSAVAFFVLFFVARAALIPSRPWITTLVAAASAIPFTVGLGIMYRRAGIEFVPDPEAATYAVMRSLAAGVAGVYVVSKSIYGLRSAIEKAVQLGQYVVHEKIGEGGMGSVYRASHAMLKRPTAVKMILPGRASQTAMARFEREVMATSRLTHPNTVAIYDYGRTHGGVFYYAMELLDGEDLAHLVAREGAQSVPRARHVLRQIAAALAEAHAAGLVHRDVKPANVMLCTRGGVHDFVKVLDFGLVKNVATAEDVSLTNERGFAGTPLYMAPESITSPEEVGPAADIYALGCIAYYLLTGRTPFEGKTIIEVCAHHVHTIPPPPSTHKAEIPADLDSLILSCLSKDPTLRPTAADLERAFA